MSIVNQILAVCPLRPNKNPSKGFCDWCGKPLPPKRRRWCSDRCPREIMRQHRWKTARSAALRRDRRRCRRCGYQPIRPEVNHIKPCLGRHAEWGCWHHADNLETLCHDCHKATTREQRARGDFNR